jgi:Allene oxide cyclase barrel like domain
MTRTRLISGVLAIMAMVAVCTVVLPASSAVGATERFRVCDKSKPGYEADADNGEEGFSAGDQFFFTDKLLDPSTGRKAGRDSGDATIIRVIHHQDALVHINAMFYFPNGKIAVFFAAKFQDLDTGQRFPITGGTGHYENATGSVLIKNHPCAGDPGTTFHFHVE